MKKLLLLILIVLLSVLSFYVIVQGTTLGGLEILGIKGIKAQSEELDQTIQKAAKLTTTDYAKALSDIDTDAKKLAQEKETYEEMTVISSSGELAVATQLENYQLDSLMVKLGNHATNKGTTANIEISTAGGTDIYNLNITATGSYIAITDFISAIENDSTLGFKIEEFKMSPAGDTLQANFKCKGITIKGISSTTSSTTVKTNTTATETTNTTDSSNTNTTNTSNTTTNTAENTSKSSQ